MKTVTLCGSMRFSRQMQDIAFHLETQHGFNVLQCVYGDGTQLSQEMRAQLSRAHYRKIDLSDGIYVVDLNGYIGQSVQQEIEYARAQGKEVLFHTEFENHS